MRQSMINHRQRDLLAVMAGSIVGGGLRLSMANWPLLQTGSAMPLPTLLANLSGSLLIGLLAGLLARARASTKASLTPLLLTGFCGGLTTFSIFSLETLAMLDAGNHLAAGGYVGLTMLLSPAAAWLGLTLVFSVSRE